MEKKARKYHPDTNPNDEKTKMIFKEIAEAYSVLRDKNKRNEYDTDVKFNVITYYIPTCMYVLHMYYSGFDRRD